RGDIEAASTDTTGLFSWDTRFLSRWVLTIDGERLASLSTDELQYFQARFFLVAGTGTVYVDSKLSVIRTRAVGDGFHEELALLKGDWDPLKLTYARSLVDLAALRFSPLSARGRSLPAAGLPWFMTMFGRDSIFTSLQALPFVPELAATTLRELAARQGVRVDD